MKINKKIIEELVGYLTEFNLSEIDYAEGTTKVKVSRTINSSIVTTESVIKKPSSKTADIDSSLKVTSPIVGTAYLAQVPGGKKFVEVGEKIKKGQTVMIVEAMKTMNHVPSTQNGTVKKILVNDGETVEFGKPLVLLS